MLIDMALHDRLRDIGAIFGKCVGGNFQLTVAPGGEELFLRVRERIDRLPFRSNLSVPREPHIPDHSAAVSMISTKSPSGRISAITSEIWGREEIAQNRRQSFFLSGRRTAAGLARLELEPKKSAGTNWSPRRNSCLLSAVQAYS